MQKVRIQKNKFFKTEFKQLVSITISILTIGSFSPFPHGTKFTIDFLIIFN